MLLNINNKESSSCGIRATTSIAHKLVSNLSKLNLLSCHIIGFLQFSHGAACC